MWQCAIQRPGFVTSSRMSTVSPVRTSTVSFLLVVSLGLMACARAVMLVAVPMVPVRAVLLVCFAFVVMAVVSVVVVTLLVLVVAVSVVLVAVTTSGCHHVRRQELHAALG